jgi:glycosyltransferase involved in cell wall biosynthesis
MTPRYSFVIPAYNEADSVQELYRQVLQAMEESHPAAAFEMLFVDDGSTDATPGRLAELAAADRRVRVLRQGRNSGKSAAYMAGFLAAQGALIVTLDADLQDNPAELPKLEAKFDEGYDLVVGWKMGRLGNEWSKTIPSRFYNGLKGWVFGLRLKDSNSGFRLMRREVAQSLDLYAGHYRFLPELAHLAGFRVGEVAVEHRARRHGHSKYGMGRFWTGLLDVLAVRFLTRFMHAPLHFFGTLGLLPFLIGSGLEIYVLVRKLTGSDFQTHIAAIIVGVMFILLGFQMIGIGLLGEMIVSMRQLRRVQSPSVPAADAAEGRMPPAQN